MRLLLTGLLVCAMLIGAAAPAVAESLENYDSTWSIVALDPNTGELGVIVTTKRPAVGNRCPWAVAGVGAVSTQASTNPLLATRVLGLLANGWDAKSVLD